MSNGEPIPTIGLEVHMHLATRTKLFCGCLVEYDAPPNSRVCPVCLGMPGVLPVMNEVAVELAVRMALALGCRIPDFAKWDRKHYYYPDLPKNYQISEYDQPLGIGGELEIPVEGGTKRIGITRVHLEEDAGKLMHAEGSGNYSVVDLNRTGTPLLEIVSEPDIRTADQARTYGEALRQLAVYLGAGHCNMQLGQMRFEPNISLRIGTGDDGEPRYTPITEIKNLNSFRSLERAVAFEIARHREEYENDPVGYTLERLGKSTRGWLDDQEVTFLQRSKEEAHDYRYMPDPDLVPFVPDRAWVEKVRASLPELPAKRRLRFIEELGLPEYDAGVLTADREIADYFEVVAALVKDAKTASNWMMQDVMRVLNQSKRPFSEFDLMLPANELAYVIRWVQQGYINRQGAKTLIDERLEWASWFTLNEPLKTDIRHSLEAMIRHLGLAQTSDAGQLEAIAEKVIADNPGPADDFRSGKEKALGRLIGMAMKASGGKANPKVVREILIRKLGG